MENVEIHAKIKVRMTKEIRWRNDKGIIETTVGRLYSMNQSLKI